MDYGGEISTVALVISRREQMLAIERKDFRKDICRVFGPQPKREGVAIVFSHLREIEFGAAANLIECKIGCFEKLIARHALRVAGNAAADRCEHRYGIIRKHWPLRNRVRDTLASQSRGLQVALEEDRELVAADPADHVSLSQASGQPLRDLDENRIPNLMAVTIDDTLEIIHIYDRDRAWTAGIGQRGSHMSPETGAILNPGEVVRLHSLRDRMLVGFPRRDVAQGHDTSDRHVAVAITGVTALILFLPQAQVLLKFGSIAWSDMALAVGLGVILLVLLEGCKPMVRRLTARVSPISGRTRIVAP